MASQTLTSGERCTCRASGWVDSVGFKGKNHPHCPNIAENQENWAVFDNYLQSSKRRSMFNTAITNPFSVPFSTTGCVLIVTPTSWHLGQNRWNRFQSEPICCFTPGAIDLAWWPGFGLPQLLRSHGGRHGSPGHPVDRSKAMHRGHGGNQ